ncbi:expansin EXLX1 family cellulose-binding protein [Streptomyces neyagawaensis]|uniref:expansin EXLX1 family cellulose-binding protein n=1 Tax=Streptomyces neyagawaensis TaxID=42238 RepID=UPI0006E3F456|nr:expansin EXLX1 family cellulose-binding protein [Streptomyces neyagawaensis]MCL6738151.1 RlpA-like double-psi beta-barrel domain-containing protein [Streptomyces neyagawaensis]MDE1685518.1 expansin EXLX1 family cellulose-binding protein [Streptomyces neyagawaensis]
MASRSHRSPRRSSRPGSRTALVSAVAVAAVALVASLVVAFGSGRGAEGEEARKVTTTAAADTPARERPTPTGRTSSPSPSPSPSASKSASPSPSPTPTAKSPKPKVTSARRAGSGTATLAGRIRPRTTYQGIATLYDAGNGDGACSFGPSPDMMIAAMNTTDYETSRACGAYVLVRSGSASVTVRITNECPAPCKPGQLDLSAQAFAKLADPSRGQIPITWSLVSPGSPDTLSIRYKTGSSRYWCGIQALGHRNPLARLEVRTGSGWTALARTGYNYFLSEHGAGCGGAIRITDIYGEQLTLDGIALRPNTVQPTRVQFARH